ncbi:hypothetical protein C8J56DRAFT_1158473 [Mycena floridula]|nr:hypothetical protein C8J56DRAFT_1158473 [Mycena floridula]
MTTVKGDLSSNFGTSDSAFFHQPSTCFFLGPLSRMDKVPFADSEPEGPLYVDPRTGRKAGAGIKIILGATVLVSLIVLPPTLFALGKRAYESTFPHIALYQNQTLDKVQDRSLVVQPLIGYDQTFDIAVSIWQKRARADSTRNTSWPMKFKPTEPGKMFNWELDEDWLYTYNRMDETEQVLYSDIVFRGLRLKDKEVQAAIEFQISVDAFRGTWIGWTDVRASFVLIPSTPSLMDHFRNTSVPESSPFSPFDRTRFWSFPFPLSSTDTRNRTDAQLALETFAISVPLVKSMEIPSQCPEGKVVDDENGWSNGVRMTSWDDPQRILKEHPFIVTRTQLRVAEEAQIFNKEAFDKARKALRGRTCLVLPDCLRRYSTYGHLDNLLEVAVPNETSETGFQTEYAYPPYMGHFGDNIGPKDLLRVPITREKCLDGSSPSSDPDPEFMNVTMHISYAGRSPSKMLLGELYQSKFAPKLLQSRHNQSASEYDKAVLQAEIEAFNGFFGHRHSLEVHPRRRLWIFGFLLPVLSFFTWQLEILYWHRCTSTVFISIPGIALLAIGDTISMIATIVETVAADNFANVPRWLWFIGLILAKVPVPLFMLTSILRIEIISIGWIPWLRRARASHSERSSERLDSRTPRLARLVILATFSLIYFVSADWFIISPFPSPPDATIWYPRNVKLFAAALQQTGHISQMILNHRTHIFAGTYKTVIWMQAARYLLTLSSFFPILFGTLHYSEGLSVSYLILGFAWLIPAFWQAVILPRPLEVPEEETKTL